MLALSVNFDFFNDDDDSRDDDGSNIYDDQDEKDSPLVVKEGPDLPEPLVDHCVVDVRIFFTQNSVAR